MTKAARTETMTGSLADQARKFGDDLLQAGANLFHAGVGVVAATEEQARDTFGRMVDRGKQYESDEKRMFSRATREAREMGRQLEQQIEKTVAATLNRAGIPSREEIQQLGSRVEALTRKVDELASSRSARKEASHG